MVVGQVEAPQAGKSESGQDVTKCLRGGQGLEPSRRRRTSAYFGLFSDASSLFGFKQSCAASVWLLLSKQADHRRPCCFFKHWPLLAFRREGPMAAA